MDQVNNVLVIPPHVPRELVVDADIYNLPGGEQDAQLAWRVFENGKGIAWSPYNGGHWVANTAESVFRFYRDTKTFSSRQIVIPKIGEEDRQIPIQIDPPDHAKYRRNIIGLFTSDAIETLSHSVRKLCVDIIEDLRPRGECEFVQEFALVFPLSIFLTMMGLPLEDRLYLRELVEKFSDTPDLEVKMAAHAELHHYIERWIEKRIAEPGDDAITMITRCTIDGRPYTVEEMRGTILLLLHGGLDTVAGMLGFMARFFAQDHHQAAYVRSKLHDEPALHQIIQEFLRRFFIVNSSRILAKDYEFAGAVMKEGDMIILPGTPFNINADRPGAEEVDFQRASTRHISFGSGPHTCAGALLAREELQIFLQEWLTRMPDVRIDPARPSRTRALPLNGVSDLWLKWDPVQS